MRTTTRLYLWKNRQKGARGKAWRQRKLKQHHQRPHLHSQYRWKQCHIRKLNLWNHPRMTDQQCRSHLRLHHRWERSSQRPTSNLKSLQRPEDAFVMSGIPNRNLELMPANLQGRDQLRGALHPVHPWPQPDQMHPFQTRIATTQFWTSSRRSETRRKTC